jgi:hypothetical protein
LVPGLWTGLFFFGCFIGPTLAGFAVELSGFRWLTFYELVATLLALAIDVSEFIFNLKETFRESFKTSSYSLLRG